MKTPLLLTTLLLATSLAPASAQNLSSARIMAPAAKGGGWDQTSRLIQQVLQNNKIIRNVSVYNVPGAGGTLGLARLHKSEGDGKLMMTMGLVMVGAIQTNNSKATLETVTPLARLTGEYEVIVVPADSPYKTLTDLIGAWKQNPRHLIFTGGSAGGTDHVTVGLLAQAAGIDAKGIVYAPSAGGNEAIAALFDGRAKAGVSGYGEFEQQIKAGKLRLLGISSKKRVKGIDAPTFIEQGLNVDIANWRGVVAPPGISAEDKKALVAALDKMHGSKEWQDALVKKNWTDMYLSGSEFDEFLKTEQTRINGVLKNIGLECFSVKIAQSTVKKGDCN